jgi:hypothetical protein
MVNLKVKQEDVHLKNPERALEYAICIILESMKACID